MAGAQLPAGWTPEQIRGVSGDREAVVLSTDLVVTWTGSPGEEERLCPQIILRFHELCLVKPVNDEDWYMGGLNEDGSIDCWSAYGDLYEALRGL
ncbi:hypothetical protein ACLIYP_21655 [Streptomyces nanhaiensis]|uniref:hypothetical protein n=1 Tax=Streptomyces nanhaiensis TaxID=679319 RepID=UPI00399C8DBE